MEKILLSKINQTEKEKYQITGLISDTKEKLGAQTQPYKNKPLNSDTITEVIKGDGMSGWKRIKE